MGRLVLVQCVVCGGSISKTADTCVHCKAPSPIDQELHIKSKAWVDDMINIENHGSPKRPIISRKCEACGNNVIFKEDNQRTGSELSFGVDGVAGGCDKCGHKPAQPWLKCECCARLGIYMTYSGPSGWISTCSEHRFNTSESYYHVYGDSTKCDSCLFQILGPFEGAGLKEYHYSSPIHLNTTICFYVERRRSDLDMIEKRKREEIASRQKNEEIERNRRVQQKESEKRKKEREKLEEERGRRREAQEKFEFDQYQSELVERENRIRTASIIGVSVFVIAVIILLNVF